MNIRRKLQTWSNFACLSRGLLGAICKCSEGANLGASPQVLALKMKFQNKPELDAKGSEHLCDAAQISLVRQDLHEDRKSSLCLQRRRESDFTGKANPAQTCKEDANLAWRSR